MSIICRDGHLWEAGALKTDAFSDCQPIMQALDTHFKGMYSADAIVSSQYIIVPCTGHMDTGNCFKRVQSIYMIHLCI